MTNRIYINTALTLACVFTIAGCGAEIRPDGPKRVVFTQPDGTQRIVETSPATELREHAINQLMTMTSDDAPEIRANAIEALSSVKARVEPIVAIALTDSNDGVRSVAAMVAAREYLNSLAPSIRILLNDSSPFVRASAMYALNTFGEDIDISEISVLLLEHQNSRVRSHAAFILGELGETSAIPLLQNALHEPLANASPIEKKLYWLQISEALIKLGNEERIDSIRAALYPSRPGDLEATALAVQIIGQLKDETSIDQLIYLSDPNSDTQMPAEVRLGVAQALARMGHTEGAFVADEFMSSSIDTVRAQSAAVYGLTRGRGNLGNLEMMMLNDPSRLTQVAAAGAIIQYTHQQTARSSAESRN